MNNFIKLNHRCGYMVIPLKNGGLLFSLRIKEGDRWIQSRKSFFLPAEIAEHVSLRCNEGS